ncbi:TetR/AcrR family transcriptional regulator [Nocardia terpenica]|uniref:TetR/AcrR family transcriptional regulator n=1 Tax=Nocardia terpenica TaxID=455432 RepID=UPI0018955A1A|nr:TetR/AcrR family transcriptional regulator [Nocardia terpenica]MBF6064347.1 TetR/AcrR family transcriptional regulator [Nocardia terpenica]MBF6106680.1 TetR/AcrR family transcriptional regulator [Nocardia terpenica]MBF6113965.1 TetR/AcrR family transcriptional regulator [Nocardia terpenica]MBF6120411.1 TetR/AcrR family transcriptional regulator [Nocardia terpenica]MBF6154932.1 TetR/AcrR family transcriptional regulator [Nocardia terpenica]
MPSDAVVTSHGGARRGRPPQTPEQADEVRARIVFATAQVFTEHGSRGLSVARIIERAGISRPTFYRYFGNAEAPLHALLTTSNEGLVGGIRAAAERSGEPVELGIGIIDAYLDWARGHGPMLRPVFAELHDPASPVSAYRERAFDDIRALVCAKFAELGRPRPALLDLDTALQVCEFVVYRVSAATAPGGEPDPGEVEAARLTMIRNVLVTLGRREDVERALAIPGIFEGTA